LASRSASAEALAALNDDAVALYAAGRHQDAIEPFEQILVACQAAFGRDHIATLTVAGNLAVTCVAVGWLEYGIRLLTANMADRARLLGDENPHTLTARDALAVAHRLAGNVDAALALSMQVADQRRRTLGPVHPDTLASQMGLALALTDAGDGDRAMVLLTATINEAEQAHGPRHPHIVALRECRGAFMMDPGR
jgi:hypothetical protein